MGNKKKKKEKEFHLSALGRYLIRKERDDFLDNFAMLVSAGIDVSTALRSIQRDTKSSRMQKVIGSIRVGVEQGMPIWKSFKGTKIVPARVLSLIRTGEEGGTLVENLEVVVSQQEKEELFKSRIRSALLYAAVVLPLTIVIGVGAAWFILPRIAETFQTLDITLPLLTRVIISIGLFLQKYGAIVVPSALLLLAGIVYFVFSFPRTKFVGQILILKVPIIRQLVIQVEVARMGYMVGTMLRAGIPILEVFAALPTITTFRRYKQLYEHMHTQVRDGASLRQIFSSYKNIDTLIPAAVQQMVIAAEQSGALAETFLQLSHRYELRTESAAKDISVLLEPILLVVIGVVVATVVLAIMLPIYSLVQAF